jgi:hypothetical protein
VSTSNERNVQIWSSTADSPSQPPTRTALAEAHAQLTSSARWNVALLFGSGVASSAFFLAALLTQSVSYAGPSLATNNSLPVPASVPQVVFQPVAAAAPVVSPPLSLAPGQKTARRASARKLEPRVALTSGPLKPAQSRLARLILGDGTYDVRPFPQPER